MHAAESTVRAAGMDRHALRSESTAPAAVVYCSGSQNLRRTSMGSRIRDHRFSDPPRPGAAFAGGEEPLPARFRSRSSFLRAGLRLLILLASLCVAAARFFILRQRYGSRLELEQRARWLHETCSLVLRSLGVEVNCCGTRPTQGLIVSNHLSYLDIPAFAAATPCVFVAKREVRNWPVFGFFARCGGTIFIDRRSRASTDAVAQQMIDVLGKGVSVLLFPEGTSTDGTSVLRFHPSLLQPAITLGNPIVAAAIGYRMAGAEERDLCYYGDVRFGPHLLQLLGRAGVLAAIDFHPDSEIYADRKGAAQSLREKVIALRRRMRHAGADGDE